ncbi:MAG TPA: hypothetical protein P5116_01215 [Eubacteriales bacterium]|nr:hypothetical protein [Clostridia bacterium]HRV72482.1 hypothetical protein [Eubacteriales bacterium]
MRRAKLYKVLRKHPYLLDPRIRMSKREALSLIDAQPRQDFKEVIASAKERSKLGDCAWRAADNVVARQVRRHTFFNALRTPWFRRIAIAAAAICIISVFFTLTPVGRTWAAEVKLYSVEILHGTLSVEYEDSGITAKPSFVPNLFDLSNRSGAHSIVYASLKEFAEQKKLNPVMVYDVGVQLERIEGETYSFGEALLTVYRLPTDAVLLLRQSWAECKMTAFSSDQTEYWHYAADEGYELYYRTDSDDTFSAVAVLNDSYVLIGSNKPVDADWLMSAFIIP